MATAHLNACIDEPLLPNELNLDVTTKGRCRQSSQSKKKSIESLPATPSKGSVVPKQELCVSYLPGVFLPFSLNKKLTNLCSASSWPVNHTHMWSHTLYLYEVNLPHAICICSLLCAFMCRLLRSQSLVSCVHIMRKVNREVNNVHNSSKTLGRRHEGKKLNGLWWIASFPSAVYRSSVAQDIY